MMAIYQLHDHSICYRDLKPENVMLEEHGDINSVKLIDFNTAKYVSNHGSQITRVMTKVGTKTYQDPIISENEDYNGFQADIWSAGILLYYLVTGINEPRYGVEFDHVSPVCADLITKLLNPKPEMRPEAFEVLEHPFTDTKDQDYAHYLI